MAREALPGLTLLVSLPLSPTRVQAPPASSSLLRTRRAALASGPLHVHSRAPPPSRIFVWVPSAGQARPPSCPL